MKVYRKSPRRNAITVLLALCSLGLQGLGILPGAADEKEVLGPRAPWTTSRLKGSPQPPEPYRIVPAFPKVRFDHPTSIEEVPGANRLLVTEMGGKIFTLVKSADVKQADLLVDSLKPEQAGGIAAQLRKYDKPWAILLVLLLNDVNH